MKEKYIHAIGIFLTLVYGVFVAFLYITEPRSLEEISLKAKNAIDNAATKGSVITGGYEIDQQLYNSALQSFRANDFVGARDQFARADPAHRDAAIQFYTAYSFYRQGWGRLSNDDALFKQGVETLARVDLLDPNFRSNDPDLQMRTTAELRHELEEGLTVSADDFNPMRLLRERK